jgi:uncharacterized surface protein with fasciclin (FAS1) repeats
MYIKNFCLASALAVVALAQDQSLSDLLSKTKDLSLLTTYVTMYPDLVQQLDSASNITVLAPSNDAFKALLKSLGGKTPSKDDVQALLTYHVLSGTVKAADITDTPAFVPTLLEDKSYTNVTGGQVVEAVTDGNDVKIVTGLLQSSTVTQADIAFAGGVVHIIDKVLTIPASTADTASAAGLTALVGALSAADLVDAVNTTPDVTIFAPNDDAFKAIGSALGDLSTKDLSNILQYHVISGTVGYSSDLQDGMKLQALNGDELEITIQDGDVFVNSAKVVVPNALVANGVVHVIDAVLNPASTAAPSKSASAGVPAYSGASSVKSLGDLTTGVPKATTTIAPDTGAGGATTTSGSAGAKSTSSPTGGAVPMMTGAVGAAALFGAGAVVMNL